MKTVIRRFTRLSTKSLALAAIAALGVACTAEAPMSPTTSAVVDAAQGSADAAALGADPGPVRPCADVTSVEVSLVPSTTRRILVGAKYAETGAPACVTPPVWTSIPQGLVRPTLDPFVVAIANSPAARLIVTASAPNGTKGRLRVR